MRFGPCQQLLDDLTEAGGRPFLEHLEDVKTSPAIEVGRKIDAPRPRMERHSAHETDQRPGDTYVTCSFPRLLAGCTENLKSRLGNGRRSRLGVGDQSFDVSGCRVVEVGRPAGDNAV